jgi:hypothetical protein
MFTADFLAQPFLVSTWTSGSLATGGDIRRSLGTCGSGGGILARAWASFSALV